MEKNTHPYADLGPEEVLQAVEKLGFEPDARVFALNSCERAAAPVSPIGL